MYKVTNKVEPILLAVIDEFEKQHNEVVCWDVTFDFLPDPSVPEDQIGWNLMPALGIYLEISGPSSDKVVSSSFYFVPYLIDQDELKGSVRTALENMRAKREAEIEAGYAELAKTVKPTGRKRSTPR